MRVRDKELCIALHRAPTQLWRSVLGGVRDDVTAATICNYAGTRIVDEDKWRKAMQKLHRLPGGGRHVARELHSMHMWLRMAVDFNQGETA